MTSTGFQMSPIQVFVKYEDGPARPRAPVHCDSIADTMYFITMMKQEREEKLRKAKDDHIVRLAMEQKQRNNDCCRNISYCKI